MIKKILIILFTLIVLPVLILVSILFFKPLFIINPKNLAWLLHRTHIFSEWSWKEARFSHERNSWFNRNFEGEFKDFCFHYSKPAVKAETCLNKISWNIDLSLSQVTTKAPLYIDSAFTNITPGKSEPKTDEGPPDIYGYWTKLWSSYIPEMDFNFHKISLITEKKTYHFDLKLLKKRESLKINSLGFSLDADPKKIVLKAPEKYPLPKKYGATRRLNLKDFVLTAHMKEDGIPISLNGFLETVIISGKSFIKLPLVDDFDSVAFRREALSKTSAEVKLLGLKESLLKYAPKPYNQLPAPFNVMDGDIIFQLTTKELDKKSVLFNGDLHIDLKSTHQRIDVTLLSQVPFNLESFKRGVISLGLDFNRLALNLPRFSKKEIPPQMKPDGRFKTTEEMRKKDPGVKGPPINAHLTALNDEALHFKTNLLEEDLRLNFDLEIKDALIKKGFLKVLPLKTKILKRPVHVKSVLVEFDAPKPPIITSKIVFPLPEYKVTMNIEGPISKPRYSVSSEPPLPESDVYAVLLFGRPMEDLGTDDKSSASTTNQILKQGLLSLTTLYFFSGSRVEYVGYDPDSKTAAAQFGLGKKSSLRLGGGQEGINSTAIRRSLGKGWYLDTSVQDTQTGTNTSKEPNYGVMLERIISY